MKTYRAKKMKKFSDIYESRNDVVKALADKAKTGGIDKADFKKAHDLYKAAKFEDLKKLIKGLDTDVAEYIADVISRHDSKAFNSMYPRAKAGDSMSKIIREHMDRGIEMAEDAQDEKRMMRSQLMFMAYAAKEIASYLDRVNDPEEWYQNKMATTHSMMKTLYSYAQGQKQSMDADDDLMAGYYGEDLKLDARKKEFKEKLRKLAYEKYGKKKVDQVDESTKAYAASLEKIANDKKLKAITPKDREMLAKLADLMKKEGYRKPTAAEIAADKKKDGKKPSGDRHSRIKKKVYGNAMGGLKDDLEEAQLSELSPALLKRYQDKAVKQFKQSDRKRNDPGYTDAKRKEHDKRAKKRWKGSQSAAQKFKDRGGYKEEVQPIEEANFKPGNLKLKDGKTVKISMDDAKAISAVMKTLSPKNRKEMESRLMADKKGFDEIMSFVQAAGI
jgi:hypothetical protein